MNIVFMGTPDFAAVSLQALIDAGHSVTHVLTKPDRPRGRGMKLTPSPVKEIAIAYGIPCRQPETLKDDLCYNEVAELTPDMIAVVAYGLFLPERWLKLPKLACVNVHGSLLPKYRGAAPIQWAVINGETETGVCTQHMAAAMDRGDVILSQSIEICDNDTYGMIYDKMKLQGAALLVDTAALIEAGKAPRTPQDDGKAT
ncbi:MAG: methionyl-tRNA formyltransferase, partial [Oscillospiraceae bacterium]|nr:methionyl-tRNA formyltransferase [Oscillospiraceae bacterium]